MNTFKRLISFNRSNVLNKILPRHYSIYEPDYLEALKPKYPLYPPLTVQIRGYDYPIIENYQSWVHKIAELMEFDVEDSYIMPAKEIKVLKYKPNSVTVEMEYILKLYERDFKICSVPSVRLPIFIRIIEAGLPAGVLLDIFEYSPKHEERRFIPDKQLLDLKKELEEMQKK